MKGSKREGKKKRINEKKKKSQEKIPGLGHPNF